MRQIFLSVFMLLILATAAVAQDETYLTWSASQAEGMVKNMRESSKIGSAFDLRGIHTSRSINYKFRATWLTPEVIRATARLQQLRNRLSDQQTRELVAEAESAGETVFLVEIDPREGSGVIPNDWRAILQPKDLKAGADGAVSRINSPNFRNIKALAGIVRRDYDWDIFWVSFPLVDKDKHSIFPVETSQIQLIVGIYDSEGRLNWQLPESIRSRIRSLSNK
ncbi:MAG: hypothetical protein IPI64_10210 [Chloracidobacterium sp.]|nr:hypothetical protein [Chloracidobacterium sp.]